MDMRGSDISTHVLYSIWQVNGSDSLQVATIAHVLQSSVESALRVSGSLTFSNTNDICSKKLLPAHLCFWNGTGLLLG